MRLPGAAVVFGALLLGALVLVAYPNSQAATGDIQGVVRDVTGAAVSAAAVTLEQSGVPRHKTASDRAGAFRFRGVPVGAYHLKIERPGFEPLSRPVTVAGGLNPALALVLRPAGARAAPEPAPARSHVTDLTGGVVGGVAGGLTATASPMAPPPFNTEAYDRIHENGFRRTLDSPLSTFSIDVDTASYANVRRFLSEGRLPPPDAVRTEELINYFRFDYPEPAGAAPFSITTEVGPCPWAPAHRLALIGLQGRRMPPQETPPRNLVFLLDVSGSMMPASKLPLVKTAMRMLVDTLTERDRVAIVVYAGASGVALSPTRGSEKAAIHQAIEDLHAGGSTNGAAGILAAYDLAAAGLVKGGINRVILATDGDFNVGVTSQGDLLRLIEEKRKTGIFLSVLGVGQGNLKDSTMEKLADAGNGNYAYLDSLHEARRVLIEEAGSTLVTIAKDVKIQVEMNPSAVAAYRLIGYENRVLQAQDFKDDGKDAGEMGAGHSVTVLYEIVPLGVALEGVTDVDPLKYQTPPAPTPAAAAGELMAVKLRYKAPDADVSQPLEVAVAQRDTPSPAHLRFAAAVAEFGMLLRESEHRKDASYGQAIALAKEARGPDPRGYRAEFIRLVELAESLARYREPGH